MKRLRIAYVINSVEGGGAASPVPAIAGVLARNGAEVEVLALTRRDGRALPAMEAAGVRVSVREGGKRDHGAALAWLDRRVRQNRPDVIWTSLTRATLLGQLVGLRRGLPVVSWQHAAFLKPANLRLLRATNRLSRLWLGDSETITALTAERLGIPPERLMTWSIFRADPAFPQAASWRPGEPVRLGSLGRLHPVKGFDVLVAALARLPALPVSWELAIGGEGDERPRLEAAILAAGLRNVRLAGYVDPRAFLSHLHAYVQPSRSEGLCIASHEAMAAGLPVVASAVGALPGTIDASVGWLVRPDDPAALAEALQRLLRDPATLAGIGARARARVLDRFGPEAFEAAGRAVMERVSRMQSAVPDPA